MMPTGLVSVLESTELSSKEKKFFLVLYKSG